MDDIQINHGETTIKIKGNSNDFGGLDLHVNAILALIDSLDFKFAEEEQHDIRDIVYLQILDALGSRMRCEEDGNKKNIEVVQSFLDFIFEEKIHETKRYKAILDQKKNDDNEWL